MTIASADIANPLVIRTAFATADPAAAGALKNWQCVVSQNCTSPCRACFAAPIRNDLAATACAASACSGVPCDGISAPTIDPTATSRSIVTTGRNNRPLAVTVSSPKYRRLITPGISSTNETSLPCGPAT
jgi:hypothetical protein